MLKKGHALFISFLTWCLTMPVSAGAAVNCVYNPNATFPATLKDWTASEGMCWFCPVFETLFKAINNLVTSMSQYMSTFFLNLMGIGILFLIAFKVGRMLVQLQDVDLMQFLGDLFKPLGRAIIATALLGAMTFSGDTIYHLLIQPIFDVSLFLGEQTLNIAVANTEVFTATQSSGEVIRQAGGTVMEACNYRGTLPDKTAFTSRELQQLICWMRTVSSSLGVGIAIGSTFVKIGFQDFFNNMGMIVSGILIFIAFFINYVMFPLKLLETIVRLGFVLMLTPLWIILWVFPVTAQYTKKAWEMFLGCCLVMISLSVIVALVIQIMNNSIQPDGLSEQLFIELGCGKTDHALKKIETGGMALFILLAFGFMCWSILGTASALAGTFISVGGDLGLEKGVAQNAVQAGGLAWKGAKTTGRLGWAGAKTIGGAIKDSIDKRKKKDTGTPSTPSTPPAPLATFPESPAGGTEQETGANDLIARQDLGKLVNARTESNTKQNDKAKGQAIQKGINDVFSQSRNADKYDDETKKVMTHLAKQVHSGKMGLNVAQAQLKNYLNTKAKRAEQTDQASSGATSAQERSEQVARDINSINTVNQNAARMESSVGKKEAEEYRSKALEDIITHSPNAQTPEDQAVLRDVAQRMKSGGLTAEAAAAAVGERYRNRAAAENAGRIAGEVAGQRMGEAAGRAAGSQSAQDELSKRRN